MKNKDMVSEKLNTILDTARSHPGYHSEEPLEKALVPPAGYRLATAEERETHDYPTDCKVMWYTSIKWEYSKSDVEWRDNALPFAVPTDYVFEKEWTPEDGDLVEEGAYGLPMDHIEKMRQNSRKLLIEPLPFADSRDILEHFVKINEIINHLNKEK